MFSYLYSNWIYFLLLLYNHKHNDHNGDGNGPDNDRTDLFSYYKQVERRQPRDTCLDTSRIQAFIANCVQNLIQRLEIIADNSTDLEVSIQSTINLRHLNILIQYLPQEYDRLNCEQLEEFEDSVNELIQSLVTISDNYGKYKSIFFNYDNIIDLTSNGFKLLVYLSTFFVSIVSLRHLFKLFRRQTVFSHKRLSLILITILSALIPFVWKWRQKYLIELSRKQCYVLATPEECLNRHSEMTFVSWIRHYMYSYEQRRHDYYRAVTVDPFWEINPLTVISELLSELVFTPLKPFGQFTGLFISSLFSTIPLYLVIPVFIFLAFCTLLLVLLLAVWILAPNRYSIKIPFLMTIQFDRHPNPTITGPASGEQSMIRKYQIKANVVNVYHSIGPNNGNTGDNYSENQIKFNESLTFETINPISIPYSELD